jgi:hypothetical protein
MWSNSKMKHSYRKFRSLLFIGLPALLLACGGSDEPSTSAAAGGYVATTFRTTGTSGQQDQLAIGSTLQINLAENGSTSGHLHAAAYAGAPAFDADMAGTWTASASGNTIDFTQAADTFVRDMLFTVGTDVNGIMTLTGDQTFSGTRIQLTLTRATVP